MMFKQMKSLFILKIITVLFFINFGTYAKEAKYFNQGKVLFEKKEFDKSKILFERDIVFDPKSEKSYLYLAKIFNIKESEEEEEFNLNSVLLLNPQNDEALYMLALLKIKQSDYNEAKALMHKFDLVCKSFCNKRSEIEKKFEKLIPDESKSKN